jgi:hypothetical protein
VTSSTTALQPEPAIVPSLPDRSPAPGKSLDDARTEAAAIARTGNEFALVPYGVAILGGFYISVAMVRTSAFKLLFPKLGVYLFAIGMPLAGLVLGLLAHVVIVTVWWRWAIRKRVDLHLVEEIAEEGLLVFRPNNILGRLQRRFLMRLPRDYPETPLHSLPVSEQDLWS